MFFHFRTIDRFCTDSVQVHNPWMKRSPNQYYLYYAGDKFIPGLQGLPGNMGSLRMYMSSAVLAEIKTIEDMAKRRESRKIRRDGGEIGVEDDTDDEEIPYVYPDGKDKRGRVVDG